MPPPGDVLTVDYLPVQVHSLAVYHEVLTVVYLPVQVHSLAVHHEVLTVDYLRVMCWLGLPTSAEVL